MTNGIKKMIPMSENFCGYFKRFNKEMAGNKSLLKAYHLSPLRCCLPNGNNFL